MTRSVLTSCGPVATRARGAGLAAGGALDYFKKWTVHRGRVSWRRVPMRRWVGVMLVIAVVGSLSGCMNQPPAEAEPQLLFADYFTNTSSPGWGQGQKTDPPVEWQITGGHYYGRLSDADSYSYRWNTTVTGLTDFRIQATTSRLGTATDHSWGIIFRAQNEAFYAFEISAGGKVQFSVWTPDDWKAIYGWEPCAAIRPAGQANELRVDVRGTSFTLYINDHMVAQASDATLSSGSVGFIVETWDDPDGGAWFDDLEVWTLAD